MVTCSFSPRRADPKKVHLSFSLKWNDTCHDGRDSLESKCQGEVNEDMLTTNETQLRPGGKKGYCWADESLRASGG